MPGHGCGMRPDLRLDGRSLRYFPFLRFRTVEVESSGVSRAASHISEWSTGKSSGSEVFGSIYGMDRAGTGSGVDIMDSRLTDSRPDWHLPGALMSRLTAFLSTREHFERSETTATRRSLLLPLASDPTQQRSWLECEAERDGRCKLRGR